MHQPDETGRLRGSTHTQPTIEQLSDTSRHTADSEMLPSSEPDQTSMGTEHMIVAAAVGSALPQMEGSQVSPSSAAQAVGPRALPVALPQSAQAIANQASESQNVQADVLHQSAESIGESATQSAQAETCHAPDSQAVQPDVLQEHAEIIGESVTQSAQAKTCQAPDPQTGQPDGAHQSTKSIGESATQSAQAETCQAPDPQTVQPHRLHQSAESVRESATQSAQAETHHAPDPPNVQPDVLHQSAESTREAATQSAQVETHQALSALNVQPDVLHQSAESTREAATQSEAETCQAAFPQNTRPGSLHQSAESVEELATRSAETSASQGLDSQQVQPDMLDQKAENMESAKQSAQPIANQAPDSQNVKLDMPHQSPEHTQELAMLSADTDEKDTSPAGANPATQTVSRGTSSSTAVPNIAPGALDGGALQTAQTGIVADNGSETAEPATVPNIIATKTKTVASLFSSEPATARPDLLTSTAQTAIAPDTLIDNAQTAPGDQTDLGAPPVITALASDSQSCSAKVAENAAQTATGDQTRVGAPPVVTPVASDPLSSSAKAADYTAQQASGIQSRTGAPSVPPPAPALLPSSARVADIGPLVDPSIQAVTSATPTQALQTSDTAAAHDLPAMTMDSGSLPGMTPSSRNAAAAVELEQATSPNINVAAWGHEAQVSPLSQQCVLPQVAVAS